MRADAYISNMDDLRDWFEINQSQKDPKPYFTLWRGTEPVQNRLIFRNEEISEPEHSFDTLSSIIEKHSAGGGTFRIYLTSKPGFNIGVHTLVRLPATSGIGIQGVAPQVNYGIYGSAREMIEAEVDRRMELYELKRELEDMKAGQRAVSGMDQVKELLEYPAVNNLIQMFGMKLMGHNPPPPRQQPAPTPGAASDAIGEPMPEYDYEVVDPALDKLNQVFPDDVEGTLQKIADWAANNPEQAKMLIGQIQS